MTITACASRPVAVFRCAAVAALLATPAAAGIFEGASAAQGRGLVTAYAEVGDDGAPRAIGLRFGDGALDDLPAEPSTMGRCFDLDGDGGIAAAECEGDHELRLALPPEVADRADIPFGWAMLNWNPQGHLPRAWQVGHFDVHFYMIPEAELDRIGVGPCGFFMDCEAFERAVVPVPERYMHPDHISVEAAVGLMGNHLIDSRTPELHDPAHAFTHTWIFGAYDGRVIFYEVMLTRDHMLANGSACHPIKQPAAWQSPGWYPTRYCIRHDPERKTHEVSIEDFVLREAS